MQTGNRTETGGRASRCSRLPLAALLASLTCACFEDAGEVHAEVVTELLGWSHRIQQHVKTHGRLPGTLASALDERAPDSSALVDPWGADYAYVLGADELQQFKLITLGEDRAEGGDGLCSDTVLWWQGGETHISYSLQQPPLWWR